ncbi:Peptide methionine sulfoxide reductase MsrB [Chlorella vulgaris]
MAALCITSAVQKSGSVTRAHASTRKAAAVHRRGAAASASANRSPAAAPGDGAASVPSRRAALAALVASVASVGAAVNASPAAASVDSLQGGTVRHTDAEWRELLSPEAYSVLRQSGTEARNASPLVKEKRVGTYLCGGCDLPLFPSAAKYESGTGWPSFFDVLPDSVKTEPDNSIAFMPRVAVVCRRCEGHLGHVFKDGPPPTGLRYCMNGVALKFEPQQA